MTDVALPLAEVIFLLGANAFFVAAEFALVKAKSIRIEALAEEGSLRARLTQGILLEIEAYLAACQLGITMASLGLGWVGEPFVASLLHPIFESAGFDAETTRLVAFVTGFLVFSALHIVVGEQVPKTFAIRAPETIALWVSLPLRGFFILTLPLTRGLQYATSAILRLFGVREASHVEFYSGEELRGLIEVSREQGALRKIEHDMLGGILDLDEVTVRQVMHHRKDMVTINADQPIEEVLATVRGSPYSRFPIWRDDPETIIGVLHAKDLLSVDHDHPVDLAALTSPPWFIPDTTSLRRQLLAFRQRRAHLALVVDEYGAILGLVTLEDILEEIVGEISDERDVEVSGITTSPDGTALVEGRVAVRDVNRQLDWELPEDEATTIAGLIIETARRIPEPGESFDVEDYRLDVERRQRHQITLVKITPPAA